MSAARKQKHILITGGAGMIGSHAAEYYARRGARVTILDNLMRSQLFGYDKKSVEYNWRYLARYPAITRIRGDVRNKHEVKKAIGRGVDLCIHTAGQPGVRLSCLDPREDFSINAFGTLNVLESLRHYAKDAAFIYCSTNKVYGEHVNAVPLVEKKMRYDFKSARAGISEAMSVDHTGHTPYGASKYTGDLYAQEYAHIYGMRTAVFRMSCIYGCRQFGFEDQGWVAYFIISNIIGRPVTIYGDGKQVRDILYVEDLIDAYDRFFRSRLTHAVVNMGGGPANTISLLELIALIEAETGIPMRYDFDRWRPFDQKVYISDIRKATKLLSWRVSTGPRDGIRRLIAWVRENERLFR